MDIEKNTRIMEQFNSVHTIYKIDGRLCKYPKLWDTRTWYGISISWDLASRLASGDIKPEKVMQVNHSCGIAHH